MPLRGTRPANGQRTAAGAYGGSFRFPQSNRQIVSVQIAGKPEDFLNCLSEAQAAVDFEAVVHQNTPVQRITGWIAVLALLLATVYAPLFHVHTGNGEAPLVHAHFPELEVAEDESVVHMERSHSHAVARSIDVLTTVATPSIHLTAAIESTDLDAAKPQPSLGFMPAASPRAHAPPALESLVPRAPPA